MIIFPEPAKPTSSMESLQPIQFGSTQRYLWKSGDHIYQSGYIPEVLSSTRSHRIRRILEEVIKPTRSHFWKHWTIFRFDPFQPNQLRPEDIQIKPCLPEDIIRSQEEFYKFIPCTSPYWIRRILIYFNLPYLESHAFKLQQLFSLEFMHEISTFQAIRNIPRKLTYPLEPSRFKKIQALYLEPKSHKRLQRLVFQFSFLLL
ncbi:hypothetical protein Bca4012_010695 [Brassica carinata]